MKLPYTSTYSVRNNKQLKLTKSLQMQGFKVSDDLSSTCIKLTKVPEREFLFRTKKQFRFYFLITIYKAFEEFTQEYCIYTSTKMKPIY